VARGSVLALLLACGTESATLPAAEEANTELNQQVIQVLLVELEYSEKRCGTPPWEVLYQNDKVSLISIPLSQPPLPALKAAPDANQGALEAAEQAPEETSTTIVPQTPASNLARQPQTVQKRALISLVLSRQQAVHLAEVVRFLDDTSTLFRHDNTKFVMGEIGLLLTWLQNPQRENINNVENWFTHSWPPQALKRLEQVFKTGGNKPLATGTSPSSTTVSELALRGENPHDSPFGEGQALSLGDLQLLRDIRAGVVPTGGWTNAYSGKITLPGAPREAWKEKENRLDKLTERLVSNHFPLGFIAYNQCVKDDGDYDQAMKELITRLSGYQKLSASENPGKHRIISWMVPLTQKLQSKFDDAEQGHRKATCGEAMLGQTAGTTSMFPLPYPDMPCPNLLGVLRCYALHDTGVYSDIGYQLVGPTIQSLQMPNYRQDCPQLCSEDPWL